MWIKNVMINNYFILTEEKHRHCKFASDSKVFKENLTELKV